MGERKGQNKYYPPDFDYKIHKSLGGYHGQHPLRERARKLDQGILIIRFEMPYNIWCDGCGNHIGMGVRYNAEKSKIGNYYTTPIYKFRMKCHLCPMHFEIKTDPANHDYVIITGARRKEQRWDPKENEQIVPEDRDTQKKLALDSMYKLEHGSEDVKRGAEQKSSIADIAERQASMLDDHRLNQLARKQFRDEKKSIAASVEKDSELKNRLSLNIDLVEESEQDSRVAQLLQYSNVETHDEKQKKLRKQIEERPIFSSPSAPSSAPSSSSSSSRPAATQNRKPSAKRVCMEKLIAASSSTKNHQRTAAFEGSESELLGSGLYKKSSALDFGVKIRKKPSNKVDLNVTKELICNTNVSETEDLNNDIKNDDSVTKMSKDCSETINISTESSNHTVNVTESKADTEVAAGSNTAQNEDDYISDSLTRERKRKSSQDSRFDSKRINNDVKQQNFSIELNGIRCDTGSSVKLSSNLNNEASSDGAKSHSDINPDESAKTKISQDLKLSESKECSGDKEISTEKADSVITGPAGRGNDAVNTVTCLNSLMLQYNTDSNSSSNSDDT